MAQGSPARLTAGEGRKFAFTLAGAFGVLAAISWWRGHARTSLVLAILAALFALAGLLVPSRLGPVQAAWMGAAHAISKVTTPIIMGIIYFLVLTPVGLVRRAFGNPLRRGGSSSAWVDRSATPRSDLTRQF